MFRFSKPRNSWFRSFKRLVWTAESSSRIIFSHRVFLYMQRPALNRQRIANVVESIDNLTELSNSRQPHDKLKSCHIDKSMAT